ncbi:PLP-dependent aminotransferase family protein [Microlunatus speluncae]|uniref:MocR-like pyridoxine biosynthesis transcription factor PdxR n=1 Tax=Microlunatus speluncae TaxID=2594267 RepID=UPI0012665608|nr:PLP-dependent aminotransferase family protein [Microlunatus speluncae]
MTDSSTNLSWDLVLDLSETEDGPLYQRLTRSLRSAVRTGRLPGGSALPPSRVLAGELGVSRATVTEAYGQLAAEGYLTARSGSVTRVRPGLVWQPGQQPQPDPNPRPWRIDLGPGIADLNAFPRVSWAEAMRRAITGLPVGELAAAYPSGHPRARRAIAGYLRRARDADADETRTFLVPSASSGMGGLARALARAGRTEIAVEDPSWPNLRRICAEHGLTPRPVPVDADGLRVDRLAALPDVRAVLITPAHQFPTGVALSPARRAALLAWCRDVDGLIIEDDYDASFRYDRAQVAALQAMAPDRVVLLGSVSKTLSPALGLGWMLVPPLWCDPVSAELGGPSTVDSVAFADLIETGRYDQQLRRLRLTYRRRRDRLAARLAADLPGLPVSGLRAGLHLVLGLPPRTDVPALINRAAEVGLHLVDHDRYRASDRPKDPPALVIGYGNLRDAQVDQAVRLLAELIS